MKYFSEIGITAQELDWVPSPTFILRRAAIMEVVRQWQCGNALEMGCGAGAISFELARRGFSCTAIETSERALGITRSILGDNKQVTISNTLPTKQSFDYLLSFEVLEHIEDDKAALSEWLEHLKPGGECLISVPAHQSKWNVTDIGAGHFRRYDRKDVEQLIEACGLIDVEITTYGWPFSLVIEKLRYWVRLRQLKKQGIDPESIALGDTRLTKESGVQRTIETRLFPLYGSWLGRKFFAVAASLQRVFYRSDRGISFMIRAKKQHA